MYLFPMWTLFDKSLRTSYEVSLSSKSANSSSLKMKLLLYTLHTIPPKIELNLYLQKKVKTWDLATVNT